MVCRLAMDLGTAQTVIADEAHGILCKEPSVVGYDKETRKALAVGNEAARLLGRTPHSIVIKRPLRAGRIEDFEAAALMLQSFLEQLGRKPKQVQLVVGIPVELSAAEKLALRNLFRDVGVRSVHLVEESIATAAHESLNLMSECAGLLIDVGAGLTELALLGSGTVLASRSLTWSGDEFQAAIERRLLQDYAFRPSRAVVESILHRMLHPELDQGPWVYRGFHMEQKKVLNFTLVADDFRPLVEEFCAAVHQALVDLMQSAGVDLHDARLCERGLILTGSAIPLEVLRRTLETRTGLPVHISAKPDESVVQGLRSMLSYADYF